MEREMLQRAQGIAWMEGEVEDAASWTRNNNKVEHIDEDFTTMTAAGGGCGPLSSFKSMLEGDWYLNPAQHDPSSLQQSHHENRDIGFCSNQDDVFLLQIMDSSSSCSPSFALDPSQPHNFLPPKSCFSSLFNVVPNIPFDNGFDLGFPSSFLDAFQANHTSNSLIL